MKFKKFILPLVVVCLLVAAFVGGNYAPLSLGEIFDPSGNPFAHRFSDEKDIRGATFVIAASDTEHKYDADYRCDGTDDQVTIQQAIDALPAGGGKILLLEGTFDLGFNGTSYAVQLSNDVSLVGQGVSTILRMQDTASPIDYNAVLLTDRNTISDLQIDLNYSNTVVPAGHDRGNGIDISDASNFIIKHLYIHDGWNRGIMGYRISGRGIIDSCSIEGIGFSDTAEQCIDLEYGVFDDFDSSNCEVIITNCLLNPRSPAYPPGGPAYPGCISFDTTGGQTNGRFIVSNCILQNAYAGVQFYTDNWHCIFEGNIIKDIQAFPMELGGQSHLVYGNIFYRSGTPINIAGDGNNFYNNLLVAQEVEVQGDYNNISNNRFHGQMLEIEGDHNNIQNNTFLRGRDTYAIVELDGDYNTVRDNYIDGITVANWGTTLTVATEIGDTTIEVADVSMLKDGYRLRIGTWAPNIEAVSQGALKVLLFADGADAIYPIGQAVNLWNTYNPGSGVEVVADKVGNIIEGNYLANLATYIIDGGINTKIYEQRADVFQDVLAVSATYVRSNEDLSAGVPLTFTIDAQPDVPRTLSGHFDAHDNITAYTIEITGVVAKGETITETLTQADGWDWETSNAFATITSIIMTARTGTGAGDTMDIGITDVLGLSNNIYATGDVYKIKKNNANATVAGAQVDATYDTYDMAVIGLAGGDDFTIWYRSNLNIVA